MPVVELVDLLEQPDPDGLFAAHAIATVLRALVASKVTCCGLVQLWVLVEHLRDTAQLATVLMLRPRGREGDLFFLVLAHRFAPGGRLSGCLEARTPEVIDQTKRTLRQFIKICGRLGFLHRNELFSATWQPNKRLWLQSMAFHFFGAVFMIPYVALTYLDLCAFGFGKISWFAIFAILGMMIGATWFDRTIARGGSDISVKVGRYIPDAAVVGGFVGAHLVHLLAYRPDVLSQDPMALLRIWEGLSSIGGFFGGCLAVVAVLGFHRVRMIPYGDHSLFAVSIAWVFGRLGCATAHDHPGRLTDFPLAVLYPDGARHDLGLYEFAFVAMILVPLLFWLSHRPYRTGAIMAATLLIYSPMRFFLDFLRADDRGVTDARYCGLTPAQYGVVALFFAGAVIAWIGRIRAWSMQPAMWGIRARQSHISIRDD